MKYELNIHVIDAKDVPGMDLNGKSDLFVEVKVDQKFRKTKTIKKTSKPPFKLNKNRLSNLG
jgi:Ca2+-dependent lipid-binding protein